MSLQKALENAIILRKNLIDPTTLFSAYSAAGLDKNIELIKSKKN